MRLLILSTLLLPSAALAQTFTTIDPPPPPGQGITLEAEWSGLPELGAFVRDLGLENVPDGPDSKGPGDHSQPDVEALLQQGAIDMSGVLADLGFDLDVHCQPFAVDLQAGVIDPHQFTTLCGDVVVAGALDLGAPIVSATPTFTF